jgi:hypothetical protein
MENDAPKPERLWKYREWNDFAVRMIVHGEVHYTKLENLNDPFDLAFSHRLPTREDELDDYARQLCAQQFPLDSSSERLVHFNNIKNEIRRLTKASPGGIVPPFSKTDLGVLCLSAIANDVLMWSHYANHHKGVCIGIRTSCLIEKRILQVSYSDDKPIIDAWSYIRKNQDVFVNATRTKGMHWKYEEEWRTVHHAGPHLYPNCVDRVVIGVRADTTTRKAVFKAVESAEHPIDLFDATIHRTQFKLEIMPAEKPQ